MGMVPVRCGACGYTTEAKTFEDELAKVRAECLSVATDLREMTQQRDDLQARVTQLEADLAAKMAEPAVHVHVEDMAVSRLDDDPLT